MDRTSKVTGVSDELEPFLSVSEFLGLAGRENKWSPRIPSLSKSNGDESVYFTNNQIYDNALLSQRWTRTILGMQILSFCFEF